MNSDALLKYFNRIGSSFGAIPRLRRFILDLAVRGKLLEPDPAAEPASELLHRIRTEKAQLVKQGEIPKPKTLLPIGNDEVPFSLPSNWRWVRLNDITSYIQRGKSPKYASNDGLPVVSQKCVQWRGLELQSAKQITRESIETYEAIRFLRDGDLLWNSTGTGTIGRLVRVTAPPSRLVCDSHVTVVRCLEVDAEYVRVWLRSDSVYGSIENRAAGSTNQVELTSQMAINQVVPLPPIAEQRRIVAKVDEIMALCDQLEVAQKEQETRRDKVAVTSLHHLSTGANGETLRNRASFYLSHFPRLIARPDQINQLRQTILNLAIRGRLVPQDSNDEPATELLKHVQAKKDRLIREKKIKKSMSLHAIDVTKNTSTPPGWAFVQIGALGNASDSSIVDGPFGSAINTARDYREFGVPVTRMSNIAPFLYRKDNGKFVDPKIFRLLKRHNVLPGDVLLGKVGSIGNAAIYPEDMPEGMIATTGVARFRVGEAVNNHYLCILLNALRPELNAIASQAVQPFLSMKTINNIVVSVPPFSEQCRIVAKVYDLMALCDRLESQLTAVQDESRRLLETVLHEALAVTA